MKENKATNPRLQMEKNTGIFSSPYINTSAGFTVKVTYQTTGQLTLVIGKTQEVAPTNATSFQLTTYSKSDTIGIKAGKNVVYVSKIEITPNPPSTPYAAPEFDLASGTYIIGQKLKMTSENGSHIVYSVNDGAKLTTESNAVEYRFPTIGTYKVMAQAVPDDTSDEKGESSWTEAVYIINENIRDEVLIWEEDFSDYNAEDVPGSEENSKYECKDGGSTTKVYNDNVAIGNTPELPKSPELLIGKKSKETSGSFTVTISDLKGCSGELKLTFNSNNGCTVTTETADCSVSDYSFAKPNASCTVNVPKDYKGSLILKFANTTSSNTRVDNFRLVGKTDPYYPLTISSVGLNTFAAHKSYVMPESLEGGIVTVDETNMKANVDYKYQPGDVVPAGEALLLKGEARKEYQLITLTEDTGTSLEKNQNQLQPALTYDLISASAGQKLYIFANDRDRGLGFYYQGKTHDGSSVKDIYGKGYLAVSGTDAVRGYALSEGEPTGIEIVEAANNDAAAGVYNLSGVRVATSTENLPAGFYIVNGKKVLVK